MSDNSIFPLCLGSFCLPLLVGIILLVVEYKSGFFSKTIKDLGESKSSQSLPLSLDKVNKDRDWENLARNPARLAVARHFGISQERVKLAGWEVMENYHIDDPVSFDIRSKLWGTILEPLMDGYSTMKKEQSRFYLEATYNILDKNRKKFIQSITVHFDSKGNPKNFPISSLPPNEIDSGEQL